MNLLLRAALSASLSDREAFVDRVSKLMEERIGKDPESARRMSDNLATAMEGMNEQLFIEQLFSSGQDNDLNKKVDKLTVAVERLTEVVERLSEQEHRSK